MRRSQGGFSSIELLFVVLWLVAIVGYIANIVQIVGMLDNEITGLFIFKAVGVLAAPLGAILGIIGMF